MFATHKLLNHSATPIFKGRLKGMRFPFSKSSHRVSRPSASKLQDLVDRLQGTSGPRPNQALSDENIRDLSSLMSKISLEEVGLDGYAAAAAQAKEARARSSFMSRMPWKPKLHKKVVYIHIYENEDFCLGIFCFPARNGLPLHDHPGMTVISRVMYGELKVEGYDWLPEHGASTLPSDPQPVILAVDDVYNAERGPFALRPTTGGNVHAFEAREHTAVLDLLWPPYNRLQGRDCRYYRLDPKAPAGTTRLMVDQRPPVPEMVSDKFRGTPIRE